VAGPAYSWNFTTQQLIGGGLSILGQDPAFRWVLRQVSGVAINPTIIDSSLELQISGVNVLRFVNPPNGVVPLKWDGRIILPNAPGPPSFTLVAIGDPATTWDISVDGYRLTLP
jgi:hypothetical protein